MVGDILQPTHLLLVLVVALLVLGPKRLPEVARHLGSGIRDFRDAISGEQSERPTSEPSRQVEPESAVVDTMQAPAPADTMQAQAAAEAMQTQAVVAEPEPVHTAAIQEPETQQADAVVAEPNHERDITPADAVIEPHHEPDVTPADAVIEPDHSEADPTVPLAAPAHPPAPAPDSADPATTELSSERPT
jgi:sec-independent protein translocase protein TatA